MIKPILFNTDMVRAILDNRKTVTRRAVKPQLGSECSHKGRHEFIPDDFIEGSGFTGFVCKKCGYGVCGPHFKFPVGTSWIRPPYRPGDILYVRETWAAWSRVEGIPPVLYYKADENAPDGIKWRPSIHMPREAARIFLRVTNVSVAKLQDITDDDIARDFDFSPEALKFMSKQQKNVACGVLWNSAIKRNDRALYGWDANPWVWVIEFERISREEAAL